jgi:cytochrome c oxidase assembly protein subunit 15
VIAHRLMKIFAIITSIGAYLMVLLGVLVTTTGSGQGCGNTWPFCHGQIIPGTITIAGIVEYSHRISAGADSTLVLILTIGTWLLYKRDFRAKLFAFLSILFVILQGALGALTVVYEGTWALSWLLSIHFGLSLIALASVVLLTIRLYQIEKEQSGLKRPDEILPLQYPVLLLLVYTYIVVYTGALVEHTGAVVGCGTQLPGCGATYLPGLASLAGIQMLHRYAAGLLWLLTLGLLVMVIRHYRERRDIVQASWWSFILITLQAISGMFNVLTQGQLLAALVHTTLISVFFSVLCYLCMQVGWPWKKTQKRQEAIDKQVEMNHASERLQKI